MHLPPSHIHICPHDDTHTIQNYRYRFWRRLLRFGVSFCCSGILLLASYSSLQYFSGEKGSMFSAVLISCINIMLVRACPPALW